MKFFTNRKAIKRFSFVLAGTLLLGTVVQASSFTKKINATFRNIKVHYNNQQKTTSNEPFIYNDSVYLPVRDVGELVGKNIHWDGSKNSVYVSDKSGSSSTTLEQLQADLNAKNFEVARLMAENTRLEKELKELKEGNSGSGVSGDLDKTLGYIEDFFNYEYSIDWNFKLSKTNSRINAEVSFDSRYDNRRWESLTKKQKENFFEDICREIRIDFKNTPVNGVVVDRRTGKEVGRFSYSARNDFSYNDVGAASLSALEKEILRYVKKIDGTNIPIDDISIQGNEDNITFTVYVDLYTRDLQYEFEDAMEDNPSDIRQTMESIQEEILYDYRFAKVQGFIEDLYSKNIIAKFDGRRLY